MKKESDDDDLGVRVGRVTKRMAIAADASELTLEHAKPRPQPCTLPHSTTTTTIEAQGKKQSALGFLWF